MSHASSASPLLALPPVPLATPPPGLLGALQALLQLAGRHLPGPLDALARSLLGEHCHSQLVLNASLGATACLRLLISKAMGLGIVLFGSILKLPQMAKIVRARSARGVSVEMYALEVVAYTISLAYAVRLGIPFSTYGENASLTLQNMVITLLILFYAPLPRLQRALPTALRPPRARVAAAALVMLLFSLALASPTLVPPRALAVLQATTIPVSLASKVPQMQELARRKETGQLSAVVVFAQLAGTVARVFTTATETHDSLLLWGFALASLFNAVIAVQYVYYWNGAGSGGGGGGDGRLLPSTHAHKWEPDERPLSHPLWHAQSWGHAPPAAPPPPGAHAVQLGLPGAGGGGAKTARKLD